jgi:hypothetical protein
VGVMAHVETSDRDIPPVVIRVVCGAWCKTLGAIAW